MKFATCVGSPAPRFTTAPSGISAATRRPISSRVSAGLPRYSRAESAARFTRIGRFFTSIRTVTGTTRVTNTPGRSTSDGGMVPVGTISSASTIVTRAALANEVLKFCDPPRKTRFPRWSALAARISAKSVVMARSRTYGRPSKYRTSLPSAIEEPYPVGV